jgi:hypothetical protein
VLVQRITELKKEGEKKRFLSVIMMHQNGLTESFHSASPVSINVFTICALFFIHVIHVKKMAAPR